MRQIIDSYLKEKTGDMIDFLEKIARIPSGTFSKGGVDAVGELVSNKLGELGFNVQKVPQDRYGDHLIAKKNGKGGKKLLCIGHIDTVFEDRDYSEYPFRVDAVQIRGPGVLDMKGGIVVMLYGMEALRMASGEIFEEIDLRVFLNTDEEIHSPTSRKLIEAEAKDADTACVFEPARPGGEYVTQRKGIGFFKVDVYGRSSHAGSQPELGVSAIDELCQFVLEANCLRDLASGTTLNVGIFEGGTRSNVIAESAHAEIDIRSFEVERIETIERKLREMAGNPVQKDAQILVTGGIVQPPMVRTKGTRQLFQILKATGKEIGVEVKEMATGGGSDGNFTAQYTPTIDGMGPQGSGAHNAAEEFILINSLVERSIIFSRFIAHWFKNFEKLKGRLDHDKTRIAL